jgi:hypothetical protein
LIDSDDVILCAEWSDLMFEFLGALRPSVDEDDRTTTSLPYIAQLDAIEREKSASSKIAFLWPPLRARRLGDSI